MENAYPLSLALYDFVPVVFFAIGSYFFVRVAAEICGERCKQISIAGSALIFLGGFSKAIWKLLFTLGIGDYLLLSEIQFVLVAPGFFILLLVVIMMSRSERTQENVGAPISLAIATWKIPFLIVMTLSSMGVQGILTYIAFRRNARIAAAGFILAFLCLVGLGAMASGEQTISRQWIEQSVNTLGQFGYMVGCFLLYQNVARSERNFQYSQ